LTRPALSERIRLALRIPKPAHPLFALERPG
jgi:hypothetical protein